MMEAEKSHDLSSASSSPRKARMSIFRNFKSFHEEEELDSFHMVQNKSNRVKVPRGRFQLIMRKTLLALGITPQWKGMAYCEVSFLLQEVFKPN